MPRVKIIFCTFFFGLMILLVSPAAKEKSLDPKYIEFRLKYMQPDIRREVEALRCILKPNELDELLEIHRDHKRHRWIDEYWSLKDPIFTTAENEIQIEHQHRVAYAESAFFMSDWPMWDQRGEVYIRYGAPTYRDIIPPEVDQYGTTPPGELWYYSQHDMYVLFEDPRSKGEYTYYLEKVRGPPGTRMSRISDAIDQSMEPSLPPPSIAVLSQYDKFQKKIGKFYKLLKTTPATYRYMFQQHQLPFVFSIDRFRGGEWVDRVDVNIEFQADLSDRIYGKKVIEYIATAVFWNTDRDEVGRCEQSLELPIAEGVIDTTREMPVQLVFSLSPGFYHMAVTVEEQYSGRISSFRADAVCEDFESKLAISDILFAGTIRPTVRMSPFNRGALEVVPRPSRRYRKNKSIPLYFEVYNLGVNEQGISSYTVEYRIVPREQPGSGFWDFIKGKNPSIDISSSFRASSYGTRDMVHMTLDSDNLWEGIFDFHVKITDEISHVEVTRDGTFKIIE